MKYNYANNKFYEWGKKNWETSATLEGKDYFNNFVFERKKKNPAICIIPKSVRLTSRRRCACETLTDGFPFEDTAPGKMIEGMGGG